jgi:RNA polymerase sigma-70 factor (ECF subfamily)
MSYDTNTATLEITNTLQDQQPCGLQEQAVVPTRYPGHETAQLVERVRQGDPTAFDEIVERFESTVLRIAQNRLGNSADAQELAQEAFIQAFRKLDQLDDPRCFAGWLRAISVRMAINRAVRRPPVTPVEPEIIASDCVEEETPLEAALTAERRTQVREGLQRLGQLDRDTLLAFYFDGHSLIEMSASFKSPVGTIKRRLHVARKRLAKELKSMAPAC